MSQCTWIVGPPSHARRLVQAAKLDARLTGQAKAGEGLTSVVRTSLENNVDHALQFVLATEHASIGARDIAGRLLSATGVHAMFVADIHHAILYVVFAVEPSLLSCFQKVFESCCGPHAAAGQLPDAGQGKQGDIFLCDADEEECPYICHEGLQLTWMIKIGLFGAVSVSTALTAHYIDHAL